MYLLLFFLTLLLHSCFICFLVNKKLKIQILNRIFFINFLYTILSDQYFKFNYVNYKYYYNKLKNEHLLQDNKKNVLQDNKKNEVYKFNNS